MLLAKEVDKRVAICDIETLRELFDVGMYNPDTGEWEEFEISSYKDDLYRLVRVYTSGKYDYLVTFNGINFDQQVLQFVAENYQNWYNKTSMEICSIVYDYAQKIVEDTRYGISGRYRESDFSIPPIDLFKIHHFDNENRRVSLKWCAFMLNMDVEEMPIPHEKEGLTREDILLVQKYRRNDIMVTEKLLRLTLGEVDVPELSCYRGKNKIEERLYAGREMGINCMNYSDVKIGEEANRIEYMRAENIPDSRSLYPKKIIHPFGKKFRKYYPKTVEFQTENLRNFVQKMGEEYVKKVKQEFRVTIGETTYTIAKGGLHSTESHRHIKVPEGYVYEDIDVGSQYPNSIDKYGVYPPHLKPTILSLYREKIRRRLEYKKLSRDLAAEGKEEEAGKFASLQELMKLQLNGGYYGKLGQKGSFLEYPEGLLKVCIGNQLEILMLIERMEMNGFKVLSGNTDGITVMYPAEKKEQFDEICRWWEEKVGNREMGKLEHTVFREVWQESVNHYIALKEDGTVKKKGRFCTEFEINKNKSKRVIPLALEAYFIRKEDPIQFIRNHRNIFDFCIARKATGNMYYEEEWREGNEIRRKTHKKLVRYFVSTKGTILYKRGKNSNGDPVNIKCEAENELGQPLITYFNTFYHSEDYGIDYNYYILDVLERIDAIEKTKRKEMFIQEVKQVKEGKQLTLF